MRHKYVADLKEFPGRKMMEISQIKEDSFPFVLKFNIYARIVKRIINKLGIEHNIISFLTDELFFILQYIWCYENLNYLSDET
jgi:hypothetical protein